MFGGGFGAGEMLVLLLVLLLFFGAARLPKLARSVGQAGKELKEGLKEGYKEQPIEGPCPFCKVEIPADSKFCPGCAKSAEDVLEERAKLEAQKQKSA